MHKNIDLYRHVRDEFTSLIQIVIERLTLLDPKLTWLSPKECMFRQNKDIRFSKDKSPYKTNFGAVIAPGGKKSPSSWFYIHIEPGKSFIAWGMYMAPAPIWNKVRSYIAKHYKELTKLTQDKKFVQTFKTILGEQLKTAPKGYPKDHPAVEYLKYKYMYINHPLTDKEVMSSGFIDTIMTCYKIQKPFQDFLNKGVNN
jgi:uncharacterized protein (TIGR02453 family)